MDEIKQETLEEEVVRLRAELAAARFTVEYGKTVTQGLVGVLRDFVQVLRSDGKTMIRTIWYLWKPDEERAFALTKPPAEEWAKAVLAEGYRLATFDLELPLEVQAEQLLRKSAKPAEGPATI